MSSRLKWGASTLVVVAVVAAIIVAGGLGQGGGEPTPAPTPTPASDGATAHLWVDDDGGTCARQGSEAAYSDSAACPSFDAAWDAATAGDRIRVVAGKYGSQTITGDKASETTIAGAGVDEVTVGDLNTNGQNLLIENMTVDVGGAHGEGWSMTSNVTARNLNVHGRFANVTFSADNVTWDGGEFGGPPGDKRAGERSCGTGGSPQDPEPILIAGGASDVTIDGINVTGQRAGGSAVCAPDGFHLDYVRIDGGADDVIIRNSRFQRLADDGPGGTSGTIFITAFAGGNSTDVTIANNVFEAGAGNQAVVINATQTECAGFKIAYNTMLPGYGGVDGCTGSNTGMEWIGNLGPRQGFGDCKGTYTRNVWQDTQALSCPHNGAGADTWVAGPRFGVGALGVNGDGSLDEGSAAIDAGEIEFCTAKRRRAGLGSVDLAGTKRPAGAACDAGAVEYDD